ncbi:ROK family protein [candidate division WWE3 bacterium]|nr:ROK family protein [candidate division WWE3 bacterium]
MYIVFDVGGTKMRIGYSVNGAQLAQVETVPTPYDFPTALEMFSRIVKRLTNGSPVKAAVGGLPGPLSADKSRLIAAPNLPLWVHQPIKERLSELLLTNDIYLENDTALVGLGEAQRGAGKGYDIVAYLTISTGFGGARLVRGRIDTRSVGFEPGHQIVDGLWALDPSHPIVDLESKLSGAALTKRYNQKPEDIKDSMVWEEAARWLAIGIHNTIVYWSPNAVVLGGSLMTHPMLSTPNVIEYVRSLLKIFPQPPMITPATLGDQGGLQGSLVYLSQQLTRTAYA